MTDGGGHVRLESLTKRFDDVVAVAGIDLDIPAGEFFSLLGPSGCGKTTTLRMIGGFERPDEGRILLDGEDMAQTPPHRRPVNTVFQNYALFPHLTVADNVAFGLRFQRVGRDEGRRRVQEALRLVQLEGFDQRRTTQLSGGQQQRVALARALVLNPRVLLLDEPLGSLDAKLRKALEIELKAIQEEVGVTFVYVTHDQEEALTMSDRIAVMSEGRVIQVGPPQEVYEAPATEYVADFLGVSNLMDAVAEGRTGDTARIRIEEFELEASAGDLDGRGPVRVVIRPERVRVEERSAATSTSGANRLPGMVERTVYVGSTSQVLIRIPGGELVQAMIPNRGDAHVYTQGTSVSVHFPPADLRVLRSDAGEPESAPADDETPTGAATG